MSKSGFTREMLRQKGFVIVDGVATRVGTSEVLSTEDGITTTRYNARPCPQAPAPAVSAPAPVGPQPIRMNQTEARFYEILKVRHLGDKIQPFFRVRISRWDDPTVSFYTADFAVWTRLTSGWTVRLYEVKAKGRKYHSDELTRPKMACMENPWIADVVLATYQKGSFSEKTIASNINHP